MVPLAMSEVATEDNASLGKAVGVPEIISGGYRVIGRSHFVGGYKIDDTDLEFLQVLWFKSTCIRTSILLGVGL